MTAKQLMLPAHRAFDSDGAPEAGATASLYLTGTLTPALFYSDSGLTISIGSTITANAAGRFDPMPYQDAAIGFRIIIADSEGLILDDIDPFYFGLVAGVDGVHIPVKTRTELAAITTLVAGDSRYLSESGIEGDFVFSAANLSAAVTADPTKAIYVAPASAPSGASGAWVRKLSTPLRPEWFGAIPNSSTFDNGPALAATSTYLNAQGGGVINLTPGVTYYVGGHTLTAGNQAVAGGYSYGPTTQYLLNLVGCTGEAVINGNGAKIKCRSGLKYGTFNDDGTAKASVAPYFLGGLSTPYFAMIRVQGCFGSVHIQDLELDGNIAAATIGGEYDDAGRQILMAGIVTDANTSPVIVDRVHSHHHGLDGMEAIWAGATETTPIYNVILRDSKFISNGRQGLSWVGGRGLVAINCKFNDTGKNIGALPFSAPGAGVDIEAEASICRDGYFENCELSNNSGCGQLHVGDVERIIYYKSVFIGTTSHASWAGTPRVKFHECRFNGSVISAYPNADPMKATKYHNCRFSADPALSSTGAVYIYGDYLIDFGGGDQNVLLDGCTVDTTGFAATNAIYTNGLALFRNLSINQVGVGTCYPRGYYSGNNVLVSAGAIDAGGSIYYGRTVINGLEYPITAPGDLNVGTTGNGAFGYRSINVGPQVDPGYGSHASLNVRSWGLAQSNILFYNGNVNKGQITADYNAGNINFQGINIPGGGAYNFYDKTLANNNLSIDNNGNVVIRGTVTASNYSGTSSGTNTGDGAYTIQTKIAGYTATETFGDIIVKADLAAGFTIVLPTAVANKARFTFKKIQAAGAIVIDANAAETIDGGLTATLNNQNESITIVSDNTNWMII